MQPWLIGAVLMPAALALIYLAAANILLNLPVVRVLINAMAPDSVNVHWRRAWSVYPFRVHARGLFATGGTPSQQWRFETPAVSATLTIWPLLVRTVCLNHLSARDIVYCQRPRPGKDFAAVRHFFPVLAGLPSEPPPALGAHTGRQGAVTRPTDAAQGKTLWKIELIGAQARGRHRIWIHQFQGVVDGQVRAAATFQTWRGPIALSNGEVDVSVNSLSVAGNDDIVRQGRMKGKFAVAPFIPAQHPGIQSLPFLTFDADISAAVRSLAFLNLYLERFHGMTVSGAGDLKGHLQLKKATLQPGSRLSASARELCVELLAHRVEGTGEIKIVVDPRTPERTQVGIEFHSLSAFPAQGRELLFWGERLTVSGRGAITLVPTEDRQAVAGDLSVNIPSVKVPDLRVYQRYLPEQWLFKLNGGQGVLRGRAALSATRLHTTLKLVSENADVGLADYRFKSNLNVALNATSASLVAAGLDITGTTIRLDDAELFNVNDDRSELWHASLTVANGVVKLRVPEKMDTPDLRQWLRGLDNNEIRTRLETGAQPIKLIGSISDLQWLPLLLKNPYQLAVHGAGEMRAELYLASGWPAAGSVLQIQPSELRVHVLDYAAEGDGHITLAVERGGRNPDLNLAVTLCDASLRRQNEATAFIDKVSLRLQAAASVLDNGRPDDTVALRLHIPSARVKDMSVYNRYLPAQSALQLLGGEAGLTAELSLTPASADGCVTLRANRLRSRVNDQEIAGELRADLKLSGGVPQKMAFDLSGSTISLDHVRVAGRQREFDQADWRARLDLHNGYAVWTQPTRVTIEAGVTMSDTRPLAAVMANQRGRYGWLEKIFTVADVRGQARLTITPDRIVVAHALAESDEIDLGAKGILDDRVQNGVIYVRYKRLHGMLRINAGSRRFHIRRARKKFDAYSPETAP